MNCVTVDGTNFSAVEINGANLEEILINLLEHPSVVNRTITKVLINGDPYNEEVPHAALEVDRFQINSLALTTHSEEELQRHFLENGHFFINTLREALPKIVEEFRLGDEMEANEHFLNFLEPLHLLINMFEQITGSIDLDDNLELGDKGSFKDFMERLGETFNQMITLQEQADWIYLADVLEFELDNFLAELLEISHLLKKVGH